MKLIRFNDNNTDYWGEVQGDEIHLLDTSGDFSLEAILRHGIDPGHTGRTRPLAGVKVKAPLDYPGKIIAIGKNYADHAKETGGDVPDHPLIFSVFPSAIIAAEEPITWSKAVTQEVDWEAELAVIIGKTARNVAEADALDYVYGYTIANDVSARDLQLRVDKQWTRGKSLDTFCPLGPVVVTADEIPDPQNLHLKTTVNGTVMQEGHTADMMFSVAYLIAYCSQMFTLQPGDLILTGTPSGVGEGMTPKRYLQHGEVVMVSIDAIGALSNPCVVTA